MTSLKDILDYEALPEEVKKLAEVYFADKIAEAEEQYGKGWDEGYAEGSSESDGTVGDLEEDKEELQELINKLEERIAELEDKLLNLSDD